ncbi:MAG: RNA-binding domain-containing protein [Sulfolobales archaeon]
MIEVRVETEVKPTEDVDKVKKAVLNLVDVSKLDVVDVGGGYKLLVGVSTDIKSLIKLHRLLRVERILDTARNVMLKSLVGENTLVLKFHKQSAYAGKASLITHDEESPLGPITLTITTDKVREVIDWLAPKTSKGRPLWESPIPKV